MEPEVQLVNAFTAPVKTSLAAAKTCYSASGIVSSDDVLVDEKSKELAKDLLQAGHHTVYQHAHFQFAISSISRACVWSFLHSHPFYNSEQVSQRYVKVKPGNFSVPQLSASDERLFRECVEKQMDAYHSIIGLLTPLTTSEYRQLFPHRHLKDARWKRQPERKAMEIARYLLPIATHTHLVHTINAITLFRYYRLCHQWDTSYEQKILVRRMVEEAMRFDPDLEHLLSEPISLEETLEYQFFTSLFPLSSTALNARLLQSFREEFDQSLQGKTSLLIAYKPEKEKLVADAIREVLGLPENALSDEEAMEGIIDPAKNPYLGSSLEMGNMSKLMRVLVHPSYTFRKRLSHTADSQDQRHRMTPASRPVLILHFDETPDYILPPLIAMNESAEKRFRETMEYVWETIGKLLKAGESRESVQYLLPNAFPIRFTESADFLNLRHKLVQRLCINAQEEIWRASWEEAIQIQEVHPRLGKFLLAPCGVRQQAKIAPFCPEGKRYCGIPLWKFPLQQYRRTL